MCLKFVRSPASVISITRALRRYSQWSRADQMPKRDAWGSKGDPNGLLYTDSHSDLGELNFPCGSSTAASSQSWRQHP